MSVGDETREKSWEHRRPSLGRKTLTPSPSPAEIVSKGQDEKPNGERRMENEEFRKKKQKKTEKNSESPRFVFFILRSAFSIRFLKSYF